jgi:hypothetical protein
VAVWRCAAVSVVSHAFVALTTCARYFFAERLSEPPAVAAEERATGALDVLAASPLVAPQATAVDAAPMTSVVAIRGLWFIRISLLC